MTTGKVPAAMTTKRMICRDRGSERFGTLCFPRTTIAAPNSSPSPSSSAPRAVGLWPGIKPMIDTRTTLTSSSMVIWARAGSSSNFRMRSMLIETATNTSPASAAEAPALATNSSCHSEAL
jgi:hypothetical protein